MRDDLLPNKQNFGVLPLDFIVCNNTLKHHEETQHIEPNVVAIEFSKQNNS